MYRRHRASSSGLGAKERAGNSKYSGSWSGYRNKLLRPFHRSVSSTPSNKMCVCQFLLFGTCKNFWVLRSWSGYRNKLLNPSHRSVANVPMNKTHVCHFLLLVRKGTCVCQFRLPRPVPRPSRLSMCTQHQPPVIDLMPSPVIEHITPSAVSYSSFGQIHEARVSVPVVQEQMNMQVIPDAQVVEQIQEQIAETIPQERDQRTDDQNARVSFPSIRRQRKVQEILGTQVVDRIQKQILETAPQVRDQRTVEQNACGSVPTVQEQVIVQGIPELQVVEQKLEQAVEALQVRLLERVQQRVDEQSKRIFERLEEFHKRLEESHKRLEISEARRAENDKLIKEIGVLWKERKQQERGHLNGSVLEPIPEHP